MIEVTIFAELSNGFVVIFGGTKYVVSDADILFQNSRAYTYPDKLIQRY